MSYDNSTYKVNTITADTIELARHHLPSDQAAELEIGCKTWAFEYQDGVRGQMTVWPNGRGAVEFGADSQWGDWDEDSETLTTEEGIVYDVNGDEVESDDE